MTQPPFPQNLNDLVLRTWAIVYSSTQTEYVTGGLTKNITRSNMSSFEEYSSIVASGAISLQITMACADLIHIIYISHPRNIKPQ